MKQKFGICEWSFPVSGPLAMKLGTMAGYEGIQLGEAGGRSMGYPLNQPEIQAAYLEAAEQYDMILHSLNLGALLSEGNLNYAANTVQGECARNSLANGFSACRALGIQTVVITVDPQTESAFENVAAHLKFAEKLAGDSGVEIAIESAQPLPEILRILENVDGHVKICMDILNPLRFGTGDPCQQILEFGRGKISHFHMKDSKRDLFQRGQRGCALLGTGDAGYDKSVETIKRIGFRGWFITENYYYLPPMNDSTKSLVALAKRDLNQMRASFAE